MICLYIYPTEIDQNLMVTLKCPQITKKTAILVRMVSFVAISDPMRTA